MKTPVQHTYKVTTGQNDAVLNISYDQCKVTSRTDLEWLRYSHLEGNNLKLTSMPFEGGELQFSATTMKEISKTKGSVRTSTVMCNFEGLYRVLRAVYSCLARRKNHIIKIVSAA